MSLPALTAPGIALRALTLDDSEALFVAHRDPQTHKYWSTPAHTSIDETRADIARTLHLPNARMWAITEDGGETLGRVGIFILREGVGEFGVIMRRQACGRGLASKAIKLIEDFAFGPLGLHRLVADVDPDNAASLNLFVRAGFQREGLLRGNWKTHLGIRDSVMLGKLRQG